MIKNLFIRYWKLIMSAWIVMCFLIAAAVHQAMGGTYERFDAASFAAVSVVAFGVLGVWLLQKLYWHLLKQ